MARRYLGIPATSAPVERVFSIRGNIVTENRNQLDPKTVKKNSIIEELENKRIKGVGR